MAINMGTAVAYLELDTSKFKKGFKSAFNDLKVFGDKSATAEQKMKGLQSAFNKTGSLLTKSVTLPLLGVGTASTKVAMDFEAKMSEVQAISGATGKEFEELEKKAIEMGAKTKFSAGESAEAFKYMAMAGWDSASMLDGIEGIMNLASASGEDLALTSDIVTDALTGFGLQAKDSAHFADVLAKASSRSNTNVAMMGETFKYVAPVAGALGYSIEDTAVAIGLMANSGIKASQAGTSLRSIFTRLVKPVGQAEKAVNELGISVTNEDGTMKSLAQTMNELRDIFNGLTDSEKAQYASMLAGQQGMSGLLAIVNASQKDFNKLTEEINNANGATQEMADIMLDNTAGAIEQLTGALESAGIIIGKQLTPYIRKLAEWITGLVEKFNSLSEEQQEQTTKWGLIIASIGPLLLIGSKLITFFSTLFNIFNVLISPITTLITSIRQFGFGLTMLGYQEGLITFFTTFMNILKTIIGAINPVIVIIGILVGAFVTLWKTNEDFREKVIGIWNEVLQVFSDFSNGIKERLETIKLRFSGIAKSIKSVWKSLCDFIAPVFEGALKIIVTLLDGALDTLLNLLDVFISIFRGDWEGLKNAIVGIVKTIVKTVLSLFTSLFNTIGSLISKAIKGIGNFIGKANEARVSASNINGSHANGLDYVPFDGYVAELHKGERVLTKQENEEYNKGRTNNNGGDTFVFYNTKPDPYTYAKQMKRTKQELLYGF